MQKRCREDVESKKELVKTIRLAWLKKPREMEVFIIRVFDINDAQVKKYLSRCKEVKIQYFNVHGNVIFSGKEVFEGSTYCSNPVFTKSLFDLGITDLRVMYDLAITLL